MGKGWSKGLTAATDARVAAMAAAHRGMRYVRRKPPGECRWLGGSETTIPLAWSDELAYVVGLLATDGCLVSGRKQIAFVSMDRELCEYLLRILGRANRIRETATALGHVAFRIQFGDARLYEWLLAIGLTPRKSMTLGALPVPQIHLLACVRGLLDGDGSILWYRYQGTGKAHGTYEALRLRFSSASLPHLIWLRDSLREMLGVAGNIGTSRPRGRANPFHQLSYGNRESALVLAALYKDEGLPALGRKRATWLAYQMRSPVGAR